VSKEIDSGALTLLNKILALPGAGAQRTVLADELIWQSLDIAQVARRSLCQVGTDGIYVIAFECVHAGADTQNAVITNPYRPGTTLRFPPFPDIVGEGFDLWILGAAVHVAAGVGNLGSAQLALTGDQSSFAMGVDQAGAAIGATSMRMPLGRWDSSATVGGAGIALQENGDPYVHIGLRMRRAGHSLQYNVTSTGALTSRCFVYCALLPTGLGQDAST